LARAPSPRVFLSGLVSGQKSRSAVAIEPVCAVVGGAREEKSHLVGARNLAKTNSYTVLEAFYPPGSRRNPYQFPFSLSTTAHFARIMCQNPGQQHKASNADQGSSSQVAVFESEDMLASIIAGIFDKPSYMTPVYVVSKAFGHAFHLARKINNGYWRRTSPPPPPRRPLPVRLETTSNGQEHAHASA